MYCQVPDSPHSPVRPRAVLCGREALQSVKETQKTEARADCCRLYANFSGCVGQALTSCSSVTAPDKEPAPADVSVMVGEACSRERLLSLASFFARL